MDWYFLWSHNLTIFIPGNRNEDTNIDLLENAQCWSKLRKTKNINIKKNNISAKPITRYLYGRFWIKRFLVEELLSNRTQDQPIYLSLIFFMGHLNSKIYATYSEYQEDLRNSISNECHEITPIILHNFKEHSQQLLYCMNKNGGHFQQLIK